MKQHDINRLRTDKWAKYVLLACAAFLTIIILALIVFMGQQGLQTFLDVSPLEFFFSADWNPDNGKFGAFSFIAGSILVTVFSILVGGPIGILGAIFIAKLAPKWMRNILQPAVNLYMAIPSVVYGYIGLTVVVPAVRDFFDVPIGFGVFTASLILSIMILPTVISISNDALLSVPKMLEEGSVALGATYWQTIWNIVLPAARPGIVTAVILGMARAIGETMAVQMVIGNSPRLVDSLFAPTSTLPSEIVVEMGNTPFGSTWGNSLFMMALVLLLISLLMIFVVRKISSNAEVRA
ncbi:MAG TPA: phosphate ABC transporter permease subunit PstC [Candidatus Avacidaminococcus intestinavium]|uniref:Phosphate transport system permease protein n=1 Tax=Candidatus Avacidaminococcus intestinavium TaxID=2840684 RepID=A0A9D1MR27_9FIRM|nr:phosphate ABC transporter permease subunit PstC [Candidatus Avacidaminococcus intestinavium]